MKKKYIVGILSLMLTSTLVWSGDIMLITKSAEEQAAAEGKSVIVTIKKEGDSDISMEMVWCPPGIYTMGSPDSELGRGDDEAPCNVIIEFCSGFWISKYEVTQAQYKAVMGYNPSYFSGDDRPVEEVSWYDAMEFCARLTAIERAACRLPEGGKYTLPTEVQWEYACRAGTTTALNSGKNLSGEWESSEMDESGWYCYNSGYMTHPVGQKKANNWGIHDMHGNVWEWCLNWHPDYEGSRRVIRGGNWNTLAYYCRSARRSNIAPGNRRYYTGFRVIIPSVL